ncbi:DNA modification methylase [Endozoicomonas sp.]|uniref:DNA modification methylase n=1 Tax=Endozoicomonas sp. TaxID=1892382 RepID=UPI003839E639
MAWKQRITGNGMESPEKLMLNPDNWRRHPPAQQAAMEGVLDDLGWIQQVIVNQRTGRLIDGHLRVELARKHKAKEVPVIYVDLSEAEEKLALATLDPISALAETDADTLQQLLGQVETDNDALLDMLADLEPPTAPEENDSLEVPEDDITNAPAVTRPGDIWQIGQHRLMCGDSTKATDVEALMDGRKARLCFTSPPYGNQRDYTTDGISDWDKLMTGVFGSTTLGKAMHQAGQVLVNLGMIHHKNEWQPYWNGWLEFMRIDGWRRFGMYVWDQGPGMPGDWAGRLAPAFELIFHFNKQKRKPNKIVPCEGAGEVSHQQDAGGIRSNDGEVGGWTHSGQAIQDFKIPDSVIRLMRQKGSIGDGIDHPAVFPVTLPQHIIEAYTNDGESCYEPFNGSGTSLIAAENTGRRMHSMELAPEYCDVTLERFRRKFPEVGIVCQQTGLSLAEMTEQRESSDE